LWLLVLILITCNLGWLHEKGNEDERRLLLDTLFERLYVQGDKVMSLELNPTFACSGQRKPPALTTKW